MWWTLVIAICSSGLLCVGATNCTTADLDYTFGRCVSGHRSVVFSWKGKNCTNRPPQPLKDLLCDVNCPSGTFLGVDLNSTKPLCMDCPANTYSFGGKLRLSDKDLNWNELPLSSQTNLHYKDDQDEIVMERADSFAVKPDNSAIQTNMALAQKDTWNLFEFRLIQKMPEDGNVSFVYSKATKPMDNENNGIFEFMINGELVLRDENLTSIDKAKKRFRLHKGYNELSWRYSFTTVAEYSDLYAEISSIKVAPTGHTSLECRQCKSSQSPPGSSACVRCPFNRYWSAANKTCLACPPNQVAFSGSDSCRPRPVCRPEYDSRPVFHSCENGTRKVTYEWRKDTICDIAKATLPSDRMIECSKCPVGSFLSDKKTGRCDPCPHGYYSSSENAETCAVCPPGKYTPLKEAYAGLESMPLEMETFCESTSPYTVDLCAFTAGWIVSNGVLTTPPHAPAGARFVMRKKLSVMQHQGKLEFTYIARGNQAQERFKIRIDNRITELQPSQVARTERFDLVPGFHVIDWIAERVSEDPAIVPLEIVSILTEGSTGSSDTCLACPTGQISTMASTRCESCSAGFAPNSFHNACTACPDGQFRSETMKGCEPCPAHTRSFDSFTKCKLYDAYNINNEFLFNMMEFDMSRHVHAETIKDLPRAESFFGPFEDASKAARFFLSLSAPLAYDVEKYQYESESESTETGHVFALFPTTGDHKHVGFSAPSLKKGKKEQKTRHYLKKNLGARLDSIDLTHAPAGNITFRYKDGDICENLVRYSAEVTLVCDKDPQAQNVLITNAFKCEYKLEWRTPYACSQCKASDTRKEMSTCAEGKRRVDIVAGKSCVIPDSKESTFVAEVVALNQSQVTHAEKEVVTLRAGEKAYGPFVYGGRYFEECSDMEFTAPVIYGVIGAFVVVSIIAAVAIFLTFRYKRQYYELLGDKDETELKDIDKGPDMAPPPDNKLEVH